MLNANMKQISKNVMWKKMEKKRLAKTLLQMKMTKTILVACLALKEDFQIQEVNVIIV